MNATNMPKDLLLQIAQATSKAVKKASAEASPVSVEAHKVASDATQPTKSGLAGLAKAAGNVLKAVAPDVVGLIPGIGPIAKVMLSTLNDDEWFSEYKANGATFNEFLQVKPNGTGNPLIAALAVVECDVLDSNDIASNIQPNSLTDSFMPAVLAYVRNRTDNVLADDTAAYYRAFILASKLYSIYYAGCKYIKLSEKQPTNIPLLYKALEPLNPVSYSAFKGVIDTLGHYLKTSVRLPYAWTEYLRWRFGTVFYSDNTGKPGLIIYDPNAIADYTPDQLEDRITSLRTQLALCGRAVADYHLAYLDHSTRWDVEDAHYDEKEYNLRLNIGSQTTVSAASNVHTLFLDSRLDINAAVQAVTISCDTDYAPIHIRGTTIRTYFAEGMNLQYYVGGNTTPITKRMDAGWYTVGLAREKLFAYRQQDVFTLPNPQISGANKLTVDIGTVSSGLYPSLSEYSDYDVGAYPMFSFPGDVYPKGWISKEMLYANPALFSVAVVLSMYGAESLQIHRCARGIVAAGQAFYTTQLSYDRAEVLTSQVEAMQRTAMRNLTRGNYKQKVSTTQRPAVKEAMAEVETAAVKEIEREIQQQ